MGLLRKPNIRRDFREDCDEKRYFWPQEIWAAYGFKRPEEMHAKDNEEWALWALGKMTLNALSHCVDALDYLVLLKVQIVFHFCAIPATMAIATLELCFMNTAVFQRNIKIRKAAAVSIAHSLTPSINFMLMSRSLAHHAIHQSLRRRLHLPRLCPQDPPKKHVKMALSMRLVNTSTLTT